MRWILGVVVLVVLVGRADADCKPAGAVLFEIDQRVEPKVKLVTATTTLFGNGAWTTVVIDVDGKVARTASGCLAASRIDRVRGDLEAATWTVSRRPITCRAHSPRFTVYKSKARTVFTERTCNPEILDADSHEALDRVLAVLHVPDDLDGGAADARCMANPLAPGCS